MQKCNVPNGVIGDWEVCREGDLVILMHKQDAWMDNGEVVDHRDFVANASGRILITGLGLGLIAEELSGKPEVKEIIVLEKEPEVIALVAPSFANNKKVKIIQADAFVRIPELGIFDFAWHDIWLRTPAKEAVKILSVWAPSCRAQWVWDYNKNKRCEYEQCEINTTSAKSNSGP